MTKPKKRSLILLIIAIIAVIIGSIIIRQLGQPVSGTITTHSIKSSTINQYKIDLTPTPLSGKYVGFNYPAGLRPKTPAPYSVPDLEEFVFTAKDTTSWLMGVDVSEPRAGLLVSDSGYTYRMAHPELYQAKQMVVNGQPVEVFADRSAAFNQVAYIMHGPLLATISLNGGDAAGTGPLQTTFMMVLKSLTWV